ncbi:MAG: IclR family transcriptional regulator [Ktedonobacteraceae bacterium]|nr:IclR family transcriptional regulator [Ktedonobacteraceae bacterium]
MEYPVIRGERNGSTGVQVIARAAEILRALKGQAEGLSLSQIASKVGLAKSTVYRIVRALEAERFVTSASPTGRIRLGLGLAPLAAWVNTEMRQQIRPYMDLLSKEVDETVDLAVLDDTLIFFVDQVVVPHRLQAISAVGATFPLHCTANGKALLAELPLEQVERLVPEHLQIFTSHTLTTREQLLNDLKQIRREGIAYDREEHTEGICALGTTIRDAMGNLAAITIPVPSVRFYGNEQHLVSALLNIRKQIKQKVEMP